MAVEILWSWGPGESRLALMRDGRLADFQLVRPEFLAGAIVRARITEMAPKMNAAFVDIGSDQAGFLNNARGFARGQSLLVQVKAEAGGGKGAQVTTDITLSARCLTYSPTRPGLTVSRRLGEERRDHLLARLSDWIGDDEGLVAKPHAANADDDQLQAEITTLRGLWRAIADDGRSAPVVLWRPDPLARLISENPGLSRIVVDDASLLVPARAAFAGAVELVGTGDLFGDNGVSDGLEQALAPVVTLACGGRVVIERTAALTAIDVDTAGANPVEANSQAVSVIARHLRLRNISGQILIDFVSVGGKGMLHKLVTSLKQAVARDPVSTHVIGITALGLVEMTRERKGPSLGELLLERDVHPQPDAQALAALKALAVEAKNRPGQRLGLTVTPAVASALSARSAALTELEARLGWRVGVTVLDTPPQTGFAVI